MRKREDDALEFRVLRESYGVGVWKAIRSGWETSRSRIRLKVGNGRRVKF